MVSVPHSTPFNGTWANLVNKARNSFHKGPETFGITKMLLLVPCQCLSLSKDLHILLTEVKKHRKVLQNEDSIITTSISSTAVRETSVSNMCWYPDDILRRCQVHSIMEKEICSIPLVGINGHRQHCSY